MGSTAEYHEKSIVVTGATSGIGRQAAASFAGLGAFVIGVGRSAERCAAAEQAIRQEHPEARVIFLMADLSVQGQVRRLAERIRLELRQAGREELDVLVNNAGLYSSRYRRTVDNIEMTFAVNHLAPFLLTCELMPVLSAGPGARVITLSSISHYYTFLEFQRPEAPLLYIGLWAYKVSKLANILFSAELNRRAGGERVHAFAVDPGLVNTEIGLKQAGWLSRQVWEHRRRHGVHPEVPTRTILYLAFDPGPPGTGEVYWQDSRPKTPSRQALRADSARRLWERSCRLCGILDPFGKVI